MTKTAYLGVFTAAAILLSYIEMLIPINFGIPGMKLGLTNLAIVLVLYLYGSGEALLISIVRIVLVGLLFGNLFSIFFSLAGGVISLIVMILMKKCGGFQIMTVSVAGGVAHNIAQLGVASLIVENSRVLYYLPVLVICGTVTGFLIGVLCTELVKPLHRLLKKEN